MKVNISLEKYRIKLKGNNKKIIIPLDPCEGKPLVDSTNEEAKIKKLYQVLHDEHNNVEPNSSR